VHVSEAGLQQIDAAALAAVGWDLAKINLSHIHLWQREQEVALDLKDGGDRRLDPGDTLQVVGRLNAGRYSRASVYWRSHDTTPGLREPPQRAPGDPVRWEEDHHYQTRCMEGYVPCCMSSSISCSMNIVCGHLY
jgi:hypothetical protein